MGITQDSSSFGTRGSKWILLLFSNGLGFCCHRKRHQNEITAPSLLRCCFFDHLGNLFFGERIIISILAEISYVAGLQVRALIDAIAEIHPGEHRLMGYVFIVVHLAPLLQRPTLWTFIVWLSRPDFDQQHRHWFFTPRISRPLTAFVASLLSTLAKPLFTRLLRCGVFWLGSLANVKWMFCHHAPLVFCISDSCFNFAMECASFSPPLCGSRLR